MMIDKENENAPKPNQVYSYYKSAANVGVTNHKHSISKSIKRLFTKLKGTTTTKSNVMAKDRVSYATCSNNSSLTHPPSMLKIDSSKRNSVASLSSSSSSSYSKQNFIRHQKKTISKSSAKNHHHHHHLPTIQNNNNLRRYSNPRHTLDLSTITNNDLGALDKSSVVQRANTICNSSMLFTSGQVQHLEEQQQMPSSVTSTTTVSSSASSMQNNEQHSVISNESQGSDSEGINPLNYDTVDTKDLLDNLELEQECIDEQKCNLLQKRLWEEDAELCLKEQIAEFLGLKDPARQRVLQMYMNNFDFSKQRLDVAFRTLCSKLYLKAESQQLDRIIEAFSRRYFECNPDTLLRCFDVVYAVAYSLLLLNTDLHVVGDWATKMSKSSFVKNTMETVQSLVFADETESTTTAQQPRKRCLSTVSRKSADFIVRPLKRNDSLPLAMTFLLNEEDSQLGNYQTVRSETHINVMQPVDTLKSNASWKSSINNINESLIRSQKTWLSDIEGLLKEIYTAVKANGIDQAVITLSLDSQRDSNDENYTLQRSKTLPKNICNPEETKDSLLRRKRGHSFIQIFEANERQQSVANIFSTKQRLSSLPTNIKNEELYKQGIVMRKHMMESTDKRAKHRHWQLCFLVITDTGLIMYKPIQQEQSALKDHEKNTKRKSTSMLLWNSSNSFFSLQDIIQHYPYWKADKDVTPITALPMNHTYTTAIPPPGWNPQRPHVFRLETNEGGVWLFESTDQFAVQAWVEACNLTAAKISKGPLPGAVSNSNYGWSMNNYSTTEQSTMNISVWYPPAPCMINSALSMVDQCNDIETQIKNLSVELDQHRELKLLVDNKFSSSNQVSFDSTQALLNWDKKLHYILQEMAKLRCYRDILRAQIM